MECLNTEPKREAEGRRRGGVEPGSYKPIDLGPIHGKTLQIFTCKHPRRSNEIIHMEALFFFFLEALFLTVKGFRSIRCYYEIFLLSADC